MKTHRAVAPPVETILCCEVLDAVTSPNSVLRDGADSLLCTAQPEEPDWGGTNNRTRSGLTTLPAADHPLILQSLIGAHLLLSSCFCITTLQELREPEPKQCLFPRGPITNACLG